MSRLSEIEARLVRINQATFQELCDNYLSRRHIEYKAFSRRGSQTGKEKTIAGTPDSFFLLEDGTYLFIETTTQQTDLKGKFKGDLLSCVDESKTGVPTEKIREVIFCFNSRFDDFEEIKIKASSYGLKVPRFIGLDELAVQINLQYRDLAKTYLGLPLDTGQIVPLGEFIKHYKTSGQGLGTPIDNPILHREKELADFVRELSTSDLIVLCGPAGTGKTRLAIEGITLFSKANPQFNVYAILDRFYDLFTDLSVHFDHGTNLLLIDDANRIDRLTQVLGYIKNLPPGRLKIVMTVRDYALEQIREITSIRSEISVKELTEDEVIDIVKGAPFNILNSKYQEEIIKISRSNPRLAIMAALLAKEKENLAVLYEVYDLYEEYFKSFTKDNGILKEPLALKVLGLTSFFQALPLNDRKTLEPILTDFSITFDDFINAVDKLEQIELVEIDFDYVRIAEQNLSTYFFYKAFFKDELLPLQVIFQSYYETNKSRIKDTIIPSNNTFGYTNVRDKLRPLLIRKLQSLSGENGRLEFLELFWFYLEGEIFEAVLKKIQAVSNQEATEHTLESIISDNDPYLSLLQLLYRYPNHADKALELSIKYVQQYPDTLQVLEKKIEASLMFDYEDEPYGFIRQRKLFELVSSEIEGNAEVQDLFLGLANRFLKFQFQQMRPGRGSQYKVYRYPLKLTTEIADLRTVIFRLVDQMLTIRKADALKILRGYYEGNVDFALDIIRFDLDLLLPLLTKHLDPSSLSHCFVVHETIAWLHRIKVTDPRFGRLKERFSTDKYQAFRKLDMNVLRGKRDYEFTSYAKFSEIKEKEIRAFFKFKSLEDFTHLAQLYFEMIDFKPNEAYQILNALNIVIDENIKVKPLIGLQVLDSIIQDHRFNTYVPILPIHTIANSDELRNAFWKLIKPLPWWRAWLVRTFSKQQFQIETIEIWRLTFLLQCPASSIKRTHAIELLSVVKSLQHSISEHFSGIEKFKSVLPSFISILAKTIVKKNDQGNVNIALIDFISRYADSIETETLKRLYLQQDAMQQHFDFDGQELLVVLKRDNGFLLEFLRSIPKDSISRRSGDHRELSVVWQLEDPTKILGEAIAEVVNADEFGLGTDMVEAFFSNIPAEKDQRANTFLLELIGTHYKNSRLISTVFQVIRQKRSNLLDEAFKVYIRENPSIEDFKEVDWINDGVIVHDGTANMGDMRVAKWQHIMKLLDSSALGVEDAPIRNWIQQNIDDNLRWGGEIRRERYMKRK